MGRIASALFALALPLVASDVFAASVTLAWDANTESDLAGYIVVYGTAPGVYTASIDVGNTLTCTVSCLFSGRQFYFGVEAYNTAQLISAPSNEVTATPVDVIGGPGGLVAAYGFGETSGSTITDLSGQANHGTFGTGVSRTADGRFGTALLFDGSSGLATIPSSATLNLTTTMTIEAWVYPTAAGGWRNAIMKEATGQHTYALYADAGGVGPAAHVQNTSDHMATASGELPLNTWTHLASTYDGSVLRLLINGVEAARTSAPAPIISATNPVRLGGDTIWGEYFTGRIDEVRIYSRVLSDTEIQTDMQTPVDTVAPSVAVTAPASGATVAAQVTLTATATDNVGIAAVQFLVDGINTGAPSTSSPYSTVWDASRAVAGSHRVTAIAFDTAGNQTPSDAVTVLVSGGDATPPQVVSVAPAAGARGVPVVATIAATFSEPLDPASVSTSTFVLRTSAGALTGTVSYSAAPSNATFVPAAPLAPGQTYSATLVSGAGGIRDLAGNPLAADVSWSFTTDTGLVAAYGFDEGTGTTLRDATGHGHDGTLTGGSWRTGRYGQAVSFNGLSNMITVPDDGTLGLQTSFTVEAWVNPARNGGWRTVAYKERSGGHTYALYAAGDTGGPAAHAQIVSDTIAASNTPLPLKTWTHVAATYDGATLQLYVNGVRAAAVAAPGAVVDSSGALRIGGNSVLGEYFQGRIDEMRLYNRALPADEIKRDMATAIATDPLVTR